MYFRLLAAMFDLPVTSTSESMHTSITVLLDSDNVGVIFGISLLSDMEAEILRFFISTSGNGGHFDLPLIPNSESVHTNTTKLLDPENVGVATGTSLVSFLEAEILRCFISTSAFWRPSSICDSRRHCTEFTSVPLCSLTTKMPVRFQDCIKTET